MVGDSKVIGFAKMKARFSDQEDVAYMSGVSVLILHIMQHMIMRYSVRKVGSNVNLIFLYIIIFLKQR